ncbi:MULTISPECIES: HEPN domain-containing protein [Atlantibacter]|uniref:HEPN domain-containing protein n=1 Tax=Atlantibacter TaxID=1903434 RepID=UPI00258FDC5C|nr:MULTISPECIES: HEPN domain-containing protein [Atlantibacter]
MKNSYITPFFQRIDILYKELDNIAPEDDLKKSKIRDEFSGLMVVSLAANYENCVKTILINYADFFHDKFSHQVEKKYNYLNSKIKYASLKEYLSHFDGDVNHFENRVKVYSSKLKNEINKTYDQILNWRHSFAHANNTVTSLSAAYRAHRYAKYILYSFEDSLIGHIERESRKLIFTNHYNINKAFTSIETNCEIMMEKLDIDKGKEKRFEEVWFYFLTAHSIKNGFDETIKKTNDCSIGELNKYLLQSESSAKECQKISKLMSKIKNEDFN